MPRSSSSSGPRDTGRPGLAASRARARARLPRQRRSGAAGGRDCRARRVLARLGRRPPQPRLVRCRAALRAGRGGAHPRRRRA
ncbi:hypothetical protein N864_21110 [Intrasporangium chromatireducens Q5-1]|uniref:Uncharacterized protein n=1 Tax=Intrasporangium chromatireducens Q5-1 TaxID=584657 RepID=W9GRH0_9MICO|nr:hypothetical protein N864_21110 [Intrasporangium chromatireducens Q5-1]